MSKYQILTEKRQFIEQLLLEGRAARNADKKDLLDDLERYGQEALIALDNEEPEITTRDWVGFLLGTCCCLGGAVPLTEYWAEMTHLFGCQHSGKAPIDR